MPPATSSILYYTSVVTETPSSVNGGTPTPTVIYLTSTAAPTLTSDSAYYYSPTAASSSASKSSPSALVPTPDHVSKSSGLGSGGVIAVAVVVPIVAIFALILGFLFFWRKRKARKAAEEQRKKEIEEYGFNPNHDPTLPPVATAYAENRSEMAEDNSGYRGWGAASSTQRKPSTHLSSGRGGATGAAVSETSSNPGGYAYQNSPSAGTGAASEGHSGDALVTGDTMGALAGAGVVGGAMARQNSDRHIHRGPSNASSAYSNGRAHSQVSDVELPGGEPGPYYHEAGPYYHDAAPQHGPYGDGSYGGEQPIIRDVQARRNTRIERAPTFPNQPNSGIAQNF